MTQVCLGQSICYIIADAAYYYRQLIERNQASVNEENTMTTLTSPLKDLKIASPCTASWDKMTRDDRSRFCSECKLNVYNLSAMSKREAEALVRSAEGRL